MKRFASWIHEAVEPTEDEVKRLVEPLDPALRELAAEATAPSEAEVRRVVLSRMRAQAAAPARGYGYAWGAGGLLAAAAAMFLVFRALPGAPTYGEAPLPLGEVRAVEQTLAFGPSIQANLSGTVRLVTAGEEGTILELLEGSGRFEVDPQGTHRRLIVRAGDVDVEVKGTVFTVAHAAGVARVGVERGRVAVRDDGVERFLSASEAFIEDEARGDGVAAAEIPAWGVEPAAAPAPAEAPVEASMAAPGAAVRPAIAPAPPATVPATVAPAMVQAPKYVFAVPSREDTARGELDGLAERVARGESSTSLDRALRTFRETHAAGPLAAEARALHLETQARGSRNLAVAREIDALLAQHPTVPNAARLVTARANVGWLSGDCAAALPWLRVAAARSGGEHAGQAAVCAVRAGVASPEELAGAEASGLLTEADREAVKAARRGR